MKPNDRVRSPYNTGTVVRIDDETVTVRWDGFCGPITLPRKDAADFEVLSN